MNGKKTPEINVKNGHRRKYVLLATCFFLAVGYMSLEFLWVAGTLPTRRTGMTGQPDFNYSFIGQVVGGVHDFSMQLFSYRTARLHDGISELYIPGAPQSDEAHNLELALLKALQKTEKIKSDTVTPVLNNMEKFKEYYYHIESDISTIKGYIPDINEVTAARQSSPVTFYSKWSDDSEPWEQPMFEFANHLSELLVFDAEYSRLSGDYIGAVDSLIKSLIIGQEYGRGINGGRCVLSTFAGAGIESRARYKLAELLADLSIDKEVLNKMGWKIYALTATRADIWDTISQKRKGALSALKLLYRTSPVGMFFFDLIYGNQIEIYKNYLENTSKTPEMPLREWIRLNKTWESTELGVLGPYIVLSYIIDGIDQHSKLAEIDLELSARLKLLALACFASGSEEVPETLEKLKATVRLSINEYKRKWNIAGLRNVELILSDIMEDPFSGKDFVYNRDARALVSVGMDSVAETADDIMIVF